MAVHECAAKEKTCLPARRPRTAPKSQSSGSERSEGRRKETRRIFAQAISKNLRQSRLCFRERRGQAAGPQDRRGLFRRPGIWRA